MRMKLTSSDEESLLSSDSRVDFAPPYAAISIVSHVSAEAGDEESSKSLCQADTFLSESAATLEEQPRRTS